MKRKLKEIDLSLLTAGAALLGITASVHAADPAPASATAGQSK